MGPNVEIRWPCRPSHQAGGGEGLAPSMGDTAHALWVGSCPSLLVLPDRTDPRPLPRRLPSAKATLTFSVVMSVSASWRFWVKMMLKTAWERLLVSFMFVAATVLGGTEATQGYLLSRGRE